MTHTYIQTKLIKAGVRNLREFGYPDCNTENILTDQIYSAFFRRMLEDATDSRVASDASALMKLLPEM